MADADAVAIWMGRILLALGVTAVWLWVLRRLGSVLRGVARRADGWLQGRGRGIAFRSVELLSVDSIARFERSLLGTTRVIAWVAVTYAWLLAVAGALDASHRVFPVVVRPLIDAVTSAGSALLAFVPNLMMLALIFVAARVVVRAAALITDAVGSGRLELAWLEPELALPTRRIVTMFVWAVALVMAAPYLPGSDSKAFLGVAIMIGILVSLGATSVTSNLLAGLVLTYSRAYRVGDWVTIGDVSGEVVALGALSTRLRMHGGEEAIIPNAVVQSGKVIHRGRTRDLAAHPDAFAATSPPPPLAPSTPPAEPGAVAVPVAVAAPALVRSPAAVHAAATVVVPPAPAVPRIAAPPPAPPLPVASAPARSHPPSSSKLDVPRPTMGSAPEIVPAERKAPVVRPPSTPPASPSPSSATPAPPTRPSKSAPKPGGATGDPT